MTLSTNEAACVYAALILQDEGLEITSDKLNKLIDAAGVEVQSIWPSIFAKALAGKDLESMLLSVGSSGPAAAAPSGGAAASSGGAAAAAPAEEAKAEEAEESDEDMGFGLFD
jgi:large subunit ribosomal protein LP1